MLILLNFLRTFCSSYNQFALSDHLSLSTFFRFQEIFWITLTSATKTKKSSETNFKKEKSKEKRSLKQKKLLIFSFVTFNPVWKNFSLCWIWSSNEPWLFELWASSDWGPQPQSWSPTCKFLILQMRHSILVYFGHYHGRSFEQ